MSENTVKNDLIEMIKKVGKAKQDTLNNLSKTKTIPTLQMQKCMRDFTDVFFRDVSPNKISKEKAKVITNKIGAPDEKNSWHGLPFANAVCRVMINNRVYFMGSNWLLGAKPSKYTSLENDFVSQSQNLSDFIHLATGVWAASFGKPKDILKFLDNLKFLKELQKSNPKLLKSPELLVKLLKGPELLMKLQKNPKLLECNSKLPKDLEPLKEFLKDLEPLKELLESNPKLLENLKLLRKLPNNSDSLKELLNNPLLQNRKSEILKNLKSLKDLLENLEPLQSNPKLLENLKLLEKLREEDVKFWKNVVKTTSDLANDEREKTVGWVHIFLAYEIESGEWISQAAVDPLNDMIATIAGVKLCEDIFKDEVKTTPIGNGTRVVDLEHYLKQGWLEFGEKSDNYLKELNDKFVKNIKKESIEYLFSWDNIPGKDDEELRKFLKYHLRLGWVKEAGIRKSNDRTIIIYKDENTAKIIMDANKEKAAIKIGDKTIYVLKVKTENDKQNIYKQPPKNPAWKKTLGIILKKHGVNEDGVKKIKGKIDKIESEAFLTLIRDSIHGEDNIKAIKKKIINTELSPSLKKEIGDSIKNMKNREAWDKYYKNNLKGKIDKIESEAFLKMLILDSIKNMNKKDWEKYKENLKKMKNEIEKIKDFNSLKRILNSINDKTKEQWGDYYDKNFRDEIDEIDEIESEEFLKQMIEVFRLLTDIKRLEVQIDTKGNITVLPKEAEVTNGDYLEWHIETNEWDAHQFEVILPKDMSSPYGNKDSDIVEPLKLLKEPQRCNSVTLGPIKWPEIPYIQFRYPYHIRFSKGPEQVSLTTVLVVVDP